MKHSSLRNHYRTTATASSLVVLMTTLAAPMAFAQAAPGAADEAVGLEEIVVTAQSGRRASTTSASPINARPGLETTACIGGGHGGADARLTIMHRLEPACRYYHRGVGCPILTAPQP